MRAARLCGWALALFLLASCRAGLEHGLDERQANEVLGALERAGIVADKAADGAQGKWKVEVARRDLPRAIARLQAEGLPRRGEQGTNEAFARGGLLPSPILERARLQASLAVDLARTFETLPGVAGARVHLNLPADDPLRGDATHPRATASVVLRLSGEPAPSEAEVRRIIAGAVGAIAVADIEIVRVAAGRADEAPRVVAFGPFQVEAKSRSALGGVLLGCLVLIMILGVTLVWSGIRLSRWRREAPAKT